MTRAVFGFIMYGIPNPYDRNATAPVLYTNGELPTAGRPSELSGATIIEDIPVTGLPGFNWGADPRHPVSEDSEGVIKISDDDEGTLGTLFLDDPEAPIWGCNTNRLTTAGTALTVVGGNPTPPSDNVPYFIGNECMTTVTSSITAHGTASLTLTRARCGSLAKVHVLRPTDYSPGEPGTADRVYLRSKPDWDAGFFCGVYCFLLDHNKAITGYVLRRGIVLGTPTRNANQEYEVAIKFIEGAINSHTIGETSKETTLEHLILVTKLTAGRPQEVSFLLKLKQAEAFFNEPLSPRDSTIISAAAVSDLQTRIKQDASITYEIKLKNDFEWVYKINNLAIYYYNSNGVAYQAVKVSCSLQPDGYTSDGTALKSSSAAGQTAGFRPWYQNSIAGNGFDSTYASGAYQGIAAPTITLRCCIRKTVVNAFLTLCCSNDGSSGGTYDKLIGGMGAALPQSFFSVGAASGNPLSVLGNTRLMLELDELLNPINTYYFDLSQGISLKTFLTNEFVASQLLCGSLQDGLVGLKSYLYESAATVTLQPRNVPVPPGKKLSPIKRLDLTSGTRVLTLEPLYRRSVRYQGATTIKDKETQPLRFWREGLQLSVADITGDLSQLVRAFYKLFGGAPLVYEVPVTIEDYIADGLEFGDAVLWSDPSIPTPQGLGIDDDFFIVGVDFDFDGGNATLKLLQNTLTVAPTVTQTGKISPTLNIISKTPLSSTNIEVVVVRPDGATFDPSLDFDGIFDEIRNNSGYVKVDSYDHAPVGEKESRGSVESQPIIVGITTVGPTTTIELEFDAAYLRGSYTTADSLITVGETKLNLPAQMTAEVSLPGVAIEVDAKALPTQGNFISFQPARPQNGATHTFKA